MKFFVTLVNGFQPLLNISNSPIFICRGDPRFNSEIRHFAWIKVFKSIFSAISLAAASNLAVFTTSQILCYGYFAF